MCPCDVACKIVRLVEIPLAVLRAALAQTSEPRTPNCGVATHMPSFSVSTSKAHPRMCSVQDSVLPRGVGLRKPHIFSSLLASSFLLFPSHSLLLSPHHSKPVYLWAFFN